MEWAQSSPGIILRQRFYHTAQMLDAGGSLLPAGGPELRGILRLADAQSAQQ